MSSANGVCKLCRYVRPKSKRICRGDFVDIKLLVGHGGHYVMELELEPLPTIQPWFRWRLRLEANNLYTSRVLVPRSIANGIVCRTQEGKPIEHLRKDLSSNRKYVRAYMQALASFGILSAVERIIKSKGFEKRYGQSSH